jgi:hypothetical protein
VVVLGKIALEKLPSMALYPVEKPKGLYTRRIMRTKPLAGFLRAVGVEAMPVRIAVKD